MTRTASRAPYPTDAQREAVILVEHITSFMALIGMYSDEAIVLAEEKLGEVDDALGDSSAMDDFHYAAIAALIDARVNSGTPEARRRVGRVVVDLHAEDARAVGELLKRYRSPDSYVQSAIDDFTQQIDKHERNK